MSCTHEVIQGDHVSSIATEYGYHDYTIIWDHPNNAQLKSQRTNPNVLLPGDSLFIPDKQQKQESGSTSAKHTFVVKQQKLKLRLILEDIYEKPITNTSCVLTVDQQEFELTSDGQGRLEQDIPAGAKSCTLVVTGDQSPYVGQSLSIKVGYLDPIDTLSGQRSRLNNLGYHAGHSDDCYDPQFLSAVEQFQCDQKLFVDGDPGSATQAKLNAVHGC